MVVVLPAPFGPSRPKNSPSRTSRSSASSATTPAAGAPFRERADGGSYTLRSACVSIAATAPDYSSGILLACFASH